MNPRLHRRLTPLYIAAFLQAFNLWYAVEKLFMQRIGFDEATIALAITLFTIVTLLVETPSGILADRWSRKGVLVLASCALIICSLACGLSDSVPMYTVSLLFIGIYFALYSGTYEAIVYDTLVEETGKGTGFEHYYGKLQMISGVALVSGSLLSGTISHFFGLQVVYFLTIPFTLLSIVALIKFREPRLHKARVAVSFHRQIRATFKTVSQVGSVRWLVLAMILLTVGTSLLFEFNQLWYIALAFPVIILGFSNALVQSCIGIGGYIASKIRQTPLAISGIGSILLGSAFLLTIPISGLVVTGQVILQSCLIALTIIVAKRLHDTIPSTNRAGVISAVSTLSKLSFAPIALAFGLVSRETTIFQAGWIVVGLVVLLLPLLYKIFGIALYQLHENFAK
ncbi:MAG TPA: MFS transporter [Candidatus Saccharimonadales bacterium]|nr:MFS transporter [Candidatus Saccharimonadales bacterium]